MNVDVKSLKSLIPVLAKLFKKYQRHVTFGIALVILLSYGAVVLKISDLSKADPDPSQVSEPAVPRVNQKAINRIQSLEQNNTQVRALLEQARNNPFQE